MTYPIHKTDGSALITPSMPLGVLQDGTLDTSTGVTLIGRNYPSYGEIQNENFIKLLQNFANDVSPEISQNALLLLPGTLWFDTANNILKVFDGTEFITTSQQITSSTAPTATNTGDQWWDTTNHQLNVWDGSAWQLIGPAYTVSQGKSGVFVETIIDNASLPHTVVNTYSNGNLISITSQATFTPLATITGYTTIVPGINLSSTESFHGTASNSTTVGGLEPTVFARNDIATSFASDISVTGNIALSNANVFTRNGSLILQNKNLNGNVELFLNTSVGNARVLSLSGTTGLVYVKADPVDPLGVATKGYADAIGNALETELSIAVADINSNVTAIYVDYIGNISTVISSTNANLNAVQSSINANVTAANAAIISANVGMNSYVGDQITSLNTALTTAITTEQTDRANAIASLDTVLHSDISNVDAKVTQITTVDIPELQANIVRLDARIDPLAPIQSPAFTGSPTAPTTTTPIWTSSGHSPASGDNSTNLATTAFVVSAVAGQKFNYTVSTNAPSGGNTGDFWFQIGG